jgi:hypothetical protein
MNGRSLRDMEYRIGKKAENGKQKMKEKTVEIVERVEIVEGGKWKKGKG